MHIAYPKQAPQGKGRVPTVFTIANWLPKTQHKDVKQQGNMATNKQLKAVKIADSCKESLPDWLYREILLDY